MNIITLIPARGGSRRFPGKNLAKLGGKTLLEWAKGRTYGPAVVMTDDGDIAAEAGRLSLEVLRNHPGDGPMARVVSAAFDALHGAEAVIVSQVTTPLGTVHGVNTVARWLESGGARTAVTVDPTTRKRTGSAYGVHQKWFAKKLRSRPVGFPDQWFDLWDAQTVLVPSDDGPDINTPADLEECERILRERDGKG